MRIYHVILDRATEVTVEADLVQVKTDGSRVFWHKWKEGEGDGYDNYGYIVAIYPNTAIVELIP